MMLIFCFHEKPKCSHQNPNLPVVLQCNGASGGSIVRRVCASNHAHKLLQHHEITQSTKKKHAAVLNFWMCDYYYCLPGESRPGCICIGHKNNEKITRRHSLAWRTGIVNPSSSNPHNSLFAAFFWWWIVIATESFRKQFNYACAVTLMTVVFYAAEGIQPKIERANWVDLITINLLLLLSLLFSGYGDICLTNFTLKWIFSNSYIECEIRFDSPINLKKGHSVMNML